MDVTHADLRHLASEIRGEIRDGHRALALDLGNQVQTARREINDRLDHINGKVGDAHERITKLEAVVEFLSDGVQKMRRRVHEIGGRVRKWVAIFEGRDGRDDDDDEHKRPITWRDFWIAFGSVMATAAVIKFVGLMK